LQTKKSSIIAKSHILDGTTGIVYLLYVGRENYAQNIQGIMTDSLYANRSNVNQTMDKLTGGSGKRFLVSKGLHHKKGSRGRARELFIANLNPINSTLKEMGVECDENKLVEIMTALSGTSDFFPKFLTNMYQIHLIRRWAWYQTLSMYFLFLSEVVRSSLVIYPMPETFKVSQEKLSYLKTKYPSLENDLQGIYSKLASPELYFNPKYIAILKKLQELLSNKESDAMQGFKFLQGLQELGLSNFSQIIDQTRVVIEIYKRREDIEAKLLEAEEALKKLAEKR
jgi:hypothetical protein